MLGVVTLLAYFGGRLVSVRRTRLNLAATLTAVLAFLVAFKILGFTIQAAASTGFPGGRSDRLLAWVVPAGLSFYSLQAVSYVVDVYRGALAPFPSAPAFALYLAFFPKALAGPFERAGHFVSQLKAPHSPKASDIYIGLKWALWGYFCKLMIADKVAGIAQPILDQYAGHSSLTLLFALYAYSFRIYFDFYGYTCIAIGVARSLGIHLSQNFADPYTATSVRDFWRRWHITLMNWLRDYVYIPLGGSRRGAVRTALATITVFLVSGLWHGASLAFIAWGLFHAILFISDKVIARQVERWHGGARLGVPLTRGVKALRWFVIFSLVSIAWLPFAVPDSRATVAILHRLTSVTSPAGAPLGSTLLLQGSTVFFLSLLAIAFLLDSLGIIGRVVSSVPRTRHETVLELTLVNSMGILLVLLEDMGGQSFIYFSF